MEPVGKVFCDGKGTHGRPWRFSPPPAGVFYFAIWQAPPSRTAPESCPECAAYYATKPYLFGIHVEAMEEIGSERTDPRTRGVNLGLPGRFVEAGRDKTGKMHYDYRPTTAAEAGSAFKAREIAARAGLTMLDVRKRVR